jgi:hypothetical protein
MHVHTYTRTYLRFSIRLFSLSIWALASISCFTFSALCFNPVHTHACTYRCMYTQTHTQIVCIHACVTYVHAHTHTHTHTHIYIYTYLRFNNRLFSLSILALASISCFTFTASPTLRPGPNLVPLLLLTRSLDVF